MPIVYSVDSAHQFIVETWNGEIAASDLAGHWRVYLADPEVMATRRTLVDLRQCNILFTGAELSALVRGMVVPILQGRDWKTAIVVDGVVEFGVARQYQVFAESYSADSIFLDVHTAMAWLLSHQAPERQT